MLVRVSRMLEMVSTIVTHISIEKNIFLSFLWCQTAWLCTLAHTCSSATACVMQLSFSQYMHSIHITYSKEGWKFTWIFSITFFPCSHSHIVYTCTPCYSVWESQKCHSLCHFLWWVGFTGPQSREVRGFWGSHGPSCLSAFGWVRRPQQVLWRVCDWCY